MSDPEGKARWVLEAKGINGIPAESLNAIADSEGIKHLSRDYPDDAWDGMLLFKGDKRAILVNTHLGNTGRHNFTFAHELGHYFLEHPPGLIQGGGQTGFRCMSEDMEKAQKPREVEANRFAVELLMPKERFRLDMVGAPLDFALIGSLANRYMVSKRACSNRILQLTRWPCIVIYTKGTQITAWTASNASQRLLRELRTIPEDSAAYRAIVNQRGQDHFSACSPEVWLARSVPGCNIYECTHVHAESSTAMTILKW
jgi:Zn-dependent peptidase ImmA (M78 family)